MGGRLSEPWHWTRPGPPNGSMQTSFGNIPKESRTGDDTRGNQFAKSAGSFAEKEKAKGKAAKEKEYSPSSKSLTTQKWKKFSLEEKEEHVVQEKARVDEEIPSTLKPVNQ